MKSKKIKNAILAMIFIIITTIATHSMADVGSFESYDSGGSSWSSGSSSHSWSSSSYGSSYSYGDDDFAFSWIGATIFIIIIVY